MNWMTAYFKVSVYPALRVCWEEERIEQEYPYWNKETHDEQKEKALARYELECQTSEARGLVVSLCRLSTVDLEEGEMAPTQLRRSDKPEYSYDGFPEAWDTWHL